MTVVDRAGETIARSTSRRKFLQRAATVTFGFAAAWSVNLVRPDLAYASLGACQSNTAWSDDCSCHPIGPCPAAHDCLSGGGCNTTYCSYYLHYHSSTGCWCSKTCCYNCGTRSSYCGHWKCCDCKCGTTYCTCQGFHYSCNGCKTAGAKCVPCC
jgi:hypothetical protein